MKIKLINQRFFWVIIFSFALIIFPLTSLALTPQQVPNPQQNYGGWVTDMADILTEDTEAKLNQQISALQAKNGTEIAIVTVPETKPSATPKQFTTELFNYWGIGKEGIDNGVLFLVSTGDRRVEIETGYGVEGILPDAKVGNIIDTKIIPQFKQDNFEQGILDGTTALIQVLENEQINVNTNTLKAKEKKSTIYTSSFLIAVSFILCGWFLSKKELRKLSQPIRVKSGIILRLDRSKQYPHSTLLRTANLLLSIGTCFLLSLSLFSLIFQNKEQELIIFLSVFLGFLGPIILYQYLSKRGSLNFSCEECQQPIELVNKEEILPLLNKPQQVANQIGSIEFAGYKCHQCHPHNTLKDFYIRAYINHNSNFETCSNCHELTVSKTSEVTKHPTYDSTGIKTITHRCHCCNGIKQSTVVLSRLERGTSSSSSSSSSSSDFGGGDSGGGGAGGDW